MTFKIRKKNGKQAIFKDGKQITEWFDEIYKYGLVEGQSNNFIAEKNNEKFIYHKLIDRRICKDLNKSSLLDKYNQNKELLKLPLLDDEC